MTKIYVSGLRKFQEDRRKNFILEEKYEISDIADLIKANESVTIRGNELLVSGISVPMSKINQYIKKVKDETGQDVSNNFSKAEVAELVIKHIIDTNLEVEKIPSSALMGGDEALVNDVDDMGDVNNPDTMSITNTEVTNTEVTDTDVVDTDVADDIEVPAEDETLEDETLEDEEEPTVEDDDLEFEELLDDEEESTEEESTEEESTEEESTEEGEEDLNLPL